MLKSNIKLNSITNIVLLLTLFFSSRRGGDTKYQFIVATIVISLIYMKKDKFKLIQENKKLYAFGVLTIILVFISFFKTQNDFKRLIDYLMITIYSIGYFLCAINIKIEKKYQNKILGFIILFSLNGVFRGINDVIINWEKLSWYRISGRTYTTIYALEVGIMIILGVFSILIWKKWYYKFIGIIYTVTNIGLLMATKSRNAMLMLPLLFLIIILIHYKKKGIIIFATGIMLGISLIKPLSTIKGFERLKTISSIEKIKSDARIPIYLYGLKKGNENKLFGIGMKYYADKKFSTKKEKNIVHFHNTFIEMYATLGIPASISMLIFLVFMLKTFYFKLEVEEKYKYLGMSIMIFLYLYGLAEPVQYFTKLYGYSYLIFIYMSYVKKTNENN